MDEGNANKTFPKSKLPLYMTAIDWDAFFEETPPPDVWHETLFRWSRDQLEAYRNHHFMKRIAECWNNPFYRRFWGDHGIEPGDIEGLEDLEKLPIFSSDDVKRSIEAHPPYGEVCGIEPDSYMQSLPLKVQTSGGTTGMPRVTLFGPHDWEYNGLFAARAMFAQGARPGDKLQITGTASLANLGWSYYCAAHHYLGMMPITTGSGLVTPSRRQLEYAFALGTTVWVSFPEYLTHLASVSEAELGRPISELPTRFLVAYLGPDTDNQLRRRVEALWRCPVYDNYGTHEAGLVAFEGPEQDGLYLMEDVGAFEFVDTETQEPVPEGEAGDIVYTHLHRRVPPLIRYNLRDLGRVKHTGTAPTGSNFRRMDKFLGRSDQMVKIRGTNVYPMACLSAITSDDRTAGEWLCVAQRFESAGVLRDELLIKVEVKSGSAAGDDLRESLERRLHNDLGLKVPVELVGAGTLKEISIGREGKPVRLLDERQTVIKRT
ncbi:MAG: hypothetical protein MJE12_30255 [Alphaproteobacteria bacterium]|nr:hypothetical protein [Alphaproteobacteria bacterium]